MLFYLFYNVYFENSAIQFNIGLCIPSTCSPILITHIIENQLQSQINVPVSLVIQEKNCYVSEKKSFSEIEIFAM